MIEPSGREKFLYYTLGLTPPAQTQEWVERDVNMTGWQIRRFLQVWIGIVIGLAIIGPIIRGVSWESWKAYTPGLMVGTLIGGIIVGVLQATVLADYIRRRALSYYEKRWARQLTT